MLKLRKIKVHKSFLHCEQLTYEQQESLWGSGYTYSFTSDGTFVTTNNDYDYNIVTAGMSYCRISNDLSYSVYTNESSNIIGSEIYGGNYDLFQFLADNTEVEWAAFLNGGVNASGTSSCLLQTTHSHTSCLTNYDIITLSKYNTFMHSHPSEGENGYSQSDWETWREMYLEDNSNMKNFGIYTVSNHQRKSYTNDVIYNNPETSNW